MINSLKCISIKFFTRVNQFDMKIFFIALTLFIFALSIRLWNFGEAGRWSDEQGLMEHGYRLLQLIEKGDFTNRFWYTTADDHPPFVYLVYALASGKDFIKYDSKEPISWGIKGSGAPIYDYDLLYARSVSLVASSLSVVLVFLVGVYFFSLSI